MPVSPLNRSLSVPNIPAVPRNTGLAGDVTVGNASLPTRSQDVMQGVVRAGSADPLKISSARNVPRDAFLHGIHAHKQSLDASGRAADIRASKGSVVRADLYYGAERLSFARDPEASSAKAVLRRLGCDESAMKRLIEHRHEAGASKLLKACNALVASDVDRYEPGLRAGDGGWPSWKAADTAQVEGLEKLVKNAFVKMSQSDKWGDTRRNGVMDARYRAVDGLEKGLNQFVDTVGLDTVRDGMGELIAPAVNDVLCGKYECGVTDAFDHLDEALGTQVGGLWVRGMEVTVERHNAADFIHEFNKLPKLLDGRNDPPKREAAPPPAGVEDPGPAIVREAMKGGAPVLYNGGNHNEFKPEIHVAAPNLAPIAEMMKDQNAKFLDVIKNLLEGKHGKDGAAGLNAYELAMQRWKPEQGQPPSQDAWLDSLQGRDGADGENGLNAREQWRQETLAANPNADVSTAAYIEAFRGRDGARGADGRNGTNGLNAREQWRQETLAANPNADVSTAAYIEAFRGRDGARGADGSNGTNGLNAREQWRQETLAANPNADVSTAAYTEAFRGRDGARGADGRNGTNGLNAREQWRQETLAANPNADVSTAAYTEAFRGRDGARGADGRNGASGLDASDQWRLEMLAANPNADVSAAAYKAAFKGDKGDKGDRGDSGVKGAEGAVPVPAHIAAINQKMRQQGQNSSGYTTNAKGRASEVGTDDGSRLGFGNTASAISLERHADGTEGNWTTTPLVRAVNKHPAAPKEERSVAIVERATVSVSQRRDEIAGVLNKQMAQQNERMNQRPVVFSA